ncbi:MAG: NUDIX domain-containing protein [Ruminiclostridium sp.]|nr:NUDIX domain-containing protein [Ruminiclostridium sp.]
MSKAEKAIITALCMVYKEDKILLQNKVSGWVGLTFPGGHIEKEESFVLGIKREIFEETGLTIYNPKLCGIKQFQTEDDERYIVIYFKTNEFEGEISSSDEGEMVWMERGDLNKNNVAKGFLDTLKAFDDDTITEMMYERQKKDDGFEWILRFY